MSTPRLTWISQPPSGLRALAVGEYLSDGRNLMRVVVRFDPRDSDPFAILEDCRTLEIDTYTPDQLLAMHLRAVPHANAG